LAVAVAVVTVVAAVVAAVVLRTALLSPLPLEPFMTLQSQLVVLRQTTETTLGFKALMRAQCSFMQPAAVLVDPCQRMPI
jgi:hypothetical protein